MPNDELLDQSADALSRLIHARALSCRELMQATLDRIGRVNPVHNAIVSLRDPDVLLREAQAKDGALARAPEQCNWLHGIPQAIKDIAPTAGLRTTMGSPLLADNVPQADGRMVERMKAAGCIVIGKTNTPEFGLGSHTFNAVFGVTRNAFDASRSAGGSSGGAAVALATRMLAVADGSDSMGSLRNPAAWNNVFGLRPSAGRVPFWPAQEVFLPSFGTEGPMARSALDLARQLDIQAGPDVRLPHALQDKPQFAAQLQAGAAAHLRIGWLGDLEGHLATEPGVLDTCEAALRRLADDGCHVEPARPGLSPAAVWQGWLHTRYWIVMARIAPHLAKPGARDQIKPEALWEHDEGRKLTAMDVVAASVARSTFYRHMLALFERFDVLALPAAQVWPFPAEWRWPQSIAGRPMDTYHRWMETTIYATFAGLPAISVPAGFSDSGLPMGLPMRLPMGLQLIGAPRGDLALLQLAARYEQLAADVLARRPTTPASPSFSTRHRDRR
jgi:amidase